MLGGVPTAYPFDFRLAMFFTAMFFLATERETAPSFRLLRAEQGTP